MKLPPRDLSPPPLPPRLSAKMEIFEEYKDIDLKENGLELIHTSTIMKRRSSAMERKSKDISLMACSSSGNNLAGHQFSSLDNNVISNTGKQQHYSSSAAPPVARRPR